jgi:hypothetical protein
MYCISPTPGSTTLVLHLKLAFRGPVYITESA